MQPKKAFWLGALTVTLLAAGAPAPAEPAPPTGIDWSAGKIVVVGEGLPPNNGSAAKRRLLAKRAAVVDGYRKLAEVVHGVQVTGETHVKELEVASDEVRAGVSGLVKNAQIADENVTADGVYEVRLEMPLFGENSLATAVFADSLTRKQLRPSAKPIADEPPPEAAMLQALNSSSGAPYSGVIVDARKLGGKAAMMPTLFDDAGRELYLGGLSISNDDLIGQGPVSYARTLDEARAHPRIGTVPLVVRAKRYRGPFHADLVLDPDEAGKLRQADRSGVFLKKMAVVIVL